MKTTLDLADHLVRQAKQRGLQEGRTLRELVADYIRLGLHGGTSVPPISPSPGMKLDPGGLPVFCTEPSGNRPGGDLETALQLEQECLMQEDIRRAGLPA